MRRFVACAGVALFVLPIGIALQLLTLPWLLRGRKQERVADATEADWWPESWHTVQVRRAPTPWKRQRAGVVGAVGNCAAWGKQ